MSILVVFILVVLYMLEYTLKNHKKYVKILFKKAKIYMN